MNYRKMVGVFASGISFGMYLIVFGMSIAVLQNRKTGPLAGKGLYWLLTILAVIATLAFTCNVSTVFVEASWSRLGSPDDPLKKKLMQAQARRVIPGLIYSLVSPLIFVIADSVAVWRAYVLWSRSPVVKGILCAAAILNILFWATNTVIRAVSGTAAILTGGNANLVILSITGLLLSTALNALASVLFGIRAWKHQTRLRQTSASMSSSRSLKVLLVVMEGGFFLCALQLISSFISVGLLLQPSAIDPLAPISLAQIVMDTVTDNVAATYPSLVVVILAFQRSAMDGDSSNTTSAVLQFNTHGTAGTAGTTSSHSTKFKQSIRVIPTEEKDYSFA
jgi:hypothetical protein